MLMVYVIFRRLVRQFCLGDLEFVFDELACFKLFGEALILGPFSGAWLLQGANGVPAGGP